MDEFHQQYWETKKASHIKLPVVRFYSDKVKILRINDIF